LGFAFSDLGFEVQRFKILGSGFDLGFAHHWLINTIDKLVIRKGACPMSMSQKYPIPALRGGSRLGYFRSNLGKIDLFNI